VNFCNSSRSALINLICSPGVRPAFSARVSGPSKIALPLISQDILSHCQLPEGWQCEQRIIRVFQIEAYGEKPSNLATLPPCLKAKGSVRPTVCTDCYRSDGPASISLPISQICLEANERLGKATGIRYFLNWFDSELGASFAGNC
jgi:hypothetical protein